MLDLSTLLQQLPPWLVYVVAAVLVAGETAVIVGLLVPAEATLLLVGFLSYAGTVRLVPAMIVMMAAAAVGDSLGFRSGRRHGPALRTGRLGDRIGDRRWARAERMVRRMGGRGVLAARWLAFVRTVLPRLVGAAGMPYGRFLPWNLAGVLSWVGSTVLIGYLAGESFRRVSGLLGAATGAVLALLACVVVLVLTGRWLGRNPDPVRALAARGAALPPLRWAGRRYGDLVRRLSGRVGAGWALALNLLAGLGLLFGIGLALGWLLRVVVAHSGLAVVDGAIADWFAARRTPGAVQAAVAVLSVLRGPVLILGVALLTLLLAGRSGPEAGRAPDAGRASRAGLDAGRASRAGRGGGRGPGDGRDPEAEGGSAAGRSGLVGALGTVGTFVPLLLLAVVAELTQPDPIRAVPGPTPAPVALFPSQNAVVTGSLCTMAWLLARGTHWPVAVAGWTGAAVGIATVALARLYLGLDTASETATAVLLGLLWTVFLMVAWTTRDRTLAAADRGSLP
ncbi:VTT domain-containing protein [Plantactinospora siamensis]|uniref:VTT domain-containing protein n=1 Tax=Plantactinospora siamensis TaxID=555372 RepID=A0ABV6P1A2_9ACTN